MGFLLTGLVLLMVLKMVFKLGFNLFKAIMALIVCAVLISIVPFTLAIIGLAIPLILVIAFISFILKVIF